MIIYGLIPNRSKSFGRSQFTEICVSLTSPEEIFTGGGGGSKYLNREHVFNKYVIVLGIYTNTRTLFHFPYNTIELQVPLPGVDHYSVRTLLVTLTNDLNT